MAYNDTPQRTKMTRNLILRTATRVNLQYLFNSSFADLFSPLNFEKLKLDFLKSQKTRFL